MQKTLQFILKLKVTSLFMIYYQNITVTYLTFNQHKIKYTMTGWIIPMRMNENVLLKGRLENVR